MIATLLLLTPVTLPRAGSPSSPAATAAPAPASAATPAAAATRTAPPSGGSGRLLSTPRAVQLALAAVALALVVFWACLASATARTQAAVQAVGRDSVPSIVAAHEIRLSLARAHAAAIDAQLADGAEREHLLAEHDHALDRAAERLVAAAQNITYGEEERGPIVALARSSRRYAAAVAAARVAPRSADAAAGLASAAKLLHQDVLPAADALATANWRHLEREYDRARAEASGTAARVVLGTLAALGALAGMSALLARRFRRLVSLPVLAAALAVLAHGVTCTKALVRAREHLRVAKADAFDSVHALARARALLLDASGDEALHVLAPTPETARAFREKVDAIAFEPTESDVSRARRGQETSVSGLLGTELRNVTFAGERAEAAQALAGFCDFLAADARVRGLVEREQSSQAAGLRLDRGERGVAGTLSRTEDALARTAEINARAFEASIARADAELAPLPTFSLAVPVLALALAVLGVRPRLREYAV